VGDALSRGIELTDRYEEKLRRLLPPGAAIFDAHLHLGQDIDGMVGDYDELEAIMARYGVGRAFAFCLDEPDRHPAFRAANDRTLAFAERSQGRVVPFVRLDLNEGPLEEAARCLDAGARGIKLHPRAQGFGATDERLGPVFALAAERRVPILIHGGRGLPPIADGLAALVERNPGATLIIAHAGIADLAALAEAMAGRNHVFFDTSAWSAVDLLDLFRRVPAEQILYASDYPYGQQPSSLLLTLRAALKAGYDERRLRGLMSENAARIADGAELPEPTDPVGPARLDQPLQLARVHQYVSMAMPLLWAQQPDAVGVLSLALNACAERDGFGGPMSQIADLLGAVQGLWLELPDLETEERFRAARLAFRLLHIADIEAVTAA
jgi:predicted TIM-barrel fold metal-dependent hydrolase